MNSKNTEKALRMMLTNNISFEEAMNTIEAAERSGLFEEKKEHEYENTQPIKRAGKKAKLQQAIDEFNKKDLLEQMSSSQEEINSYKRAVKKLEEIKQDERMREISQMPAKELFEKLSFSELQKLYDEHPQMMKNKNEEYQRSKENTEE